MSVIQQILDSKSAGKALSMSVTQSTFGELPVFVVEHKTCTAAISLQGGQLLFWQPKPETTPVIWLSEKALFKKGTAIRGGVPICWPWFGNMGKPAHGFVRTLTWQLDSLREDMNGVYFVLSLTDSEETKPYFAEPFELKLDIHLGRVCKIELHCWGDFEATSALHSYFGVNDISAVTVKGLGKHYQDRLSAENNPAVAGQLSFDQAVDRIYTDAAQTVTVQDEQRAFKITSINASDVVTWNPWSEQAKAMVDVADDGYKNMVCVETARINRPMPLSSTKKSSYGFKVELL